MKIKSISTTITKKFFDMKMEDMKESGYFIEFKECKPFWDIGLAEYESNESNKDNLNVGIIFLVGNKPYLFKVISIWRVHRDFVYAKYAGAIKTEFAYAIKCVEEELNNINNINNNNGSKIYTRRVAVPSDSF